MTANKLYNRKIIAISASIFALSYVTAQAGVIDMRAKVRTNPNLIHHYTFEGPQEDAATLRTEDHAGTAKLELSKGNASVYATYTAAYDQLSMGGAPTYMTNGYSYGSAWRTTNAIALPTTMTVECLFRPNEIPSNETYVLATRDADLNRGYYFRQSTGGTIDTCIGTALKYWTIVDNYATGHWYYVVSTYVVSSGKTTINSYYADITAGDELQHTIIDQVVNGHYGTNAVLGVGSLSLGNPQYFAPCTIDEAALYNAVLDVDTIDSHYTELKRALPSVEYREIFPNDTSTINRNIPREGWHTHWNSNAIHLTAGAFIANTNTAFNADIEAIASFPTETGVTQGYLTNHGGPTGTNYLYWTEEMTNQVEISWLKLVQFDVRFAATRNVSFTIRIDTNATPANTADDIWYYGLDFDGAPGTSKLVIPGYKIIEGDVWHRHWFELGAGEWAVLDFEAGLRLLPGDTKVALPTNGLITAFGFFEELHVNASNERFDNVTLYTRHLYPPPPPKGTVLLIF